MGRNVFQNVIVAQRQQPHCNHFSLFIRKTVSISNKERKSVVLMVLREAQNHKNNNEFFSYFELLNFWLLVFYYNYSYFYDKGR